LAEHAYGGRPVARRAHKESCPQDIVHIGWKPKVVGLPIWKRYLPLPRQRELMSAPDASNITTDLRKEPSFLSNFVGTKLEAFNHRGRADFQSSHDLEDVVAIVDGRQQLLKDVERSPEDLRTYIADQMQNLLQTREFLDSLPGYLMPDTGSQQRIGMLTTKLEQLAKMK
jgi:hypothetical protein